MSYRALIRRAGANANKPMQDGLLLGSLAASHLKKQPADFNALLRGRLWVES
ncbi:hypothetical protein [Hymenobacter negativus]|uniref:Uncharacterized protein n=1 Tax=Hymenobacter negativus TaxID=2795026 RepID=A0ABS0Q4B1_9BACT|nr:hypothetical protein [Hymenobacter negativus]MBH8557402.1 hypothetical protein [Hymenobacter negativus]